MVIKSPFGKLPKSASIVLLITLSFCWIIFSNFKLKIAAIAFSCLYSLIEYTWIGTTVLRSDGEVVFSPFSKDKRKPETTYEQFFANVLILPFIIEGVMTIFPSSILRVIFFPVLIWIIEIIEGYTLMLIYGYNPAWYYTGKDAMFHGNIKLRYLPHWLLTGLFFELFLAKLLTIYL